MKRFWTGLRRLFASQSFESPRRQFIRPRLEQLESRLAPAVSLINHFDSIWSGGSAPDTCGAAGPYSYVESVNHGVTLYNKSTNATISYAYLSTFLHTVGGITFKGSLSDAVSMYDEPIGRFIVGDMDDGGANNSALDIAVSKSSNPTAFDANNWYFYQLDMSEAHESCDYPGNMGYNADGFFFTYNMFATDGSGTYHTQVAAIPNSAIASGSGFTWYSYDQSPFNYRPVTMHDSSSGGPMWFVHDNGSGSVQLIRMDNPISAGAASFHTYSIGVNSYGGANQPKNPDGTTITPGPNGLADTKILKAAERYNHIVACHSVGNGSNEDDAHWYEFNVSNINSPYLEQQGSVGYGANTYVMYPAIDINYNGDIGMGFEKVGNDTSTDYMSTYVTGHKTGVDGSGVMETAVQTKAGDSNNHTGRMGDFSGINVDPSDGTFWVNDEYTAGSSPHQEIANFQINKQNFYLAGSQLQIIGDQLGTNYGDTITVNVNGRGGVYATLNGEPVGFDAGQITSIYIDPKGGTNYVYIYNVPASCPVDITGDGVNYDTIGNGSNGVQGIKSYVFAYNGYPTPSTTGYTYLTIDDGADGTGRSATLNDVPYGVGSYQEGFISGLAPAPIYWFDNSSGTYTGGAYYVQIYGGHGSNTFTVTNTGKLWSGTYLKSGTGSNTVNVEGTTGSLTVDGGSGFQAVYIGSNGSALGGTLANIHGSVFVENSITSGYTWLYADDSGDLTGRTWNLNFDQVTCTGMPSTISWNTYGPGYGGVTYLQVRGGKSTNTMNVNATGSGSFSYGTDVYTGTGGATVYVYNTLGNMDVINQGGQDYVYVGSGGGALNGTMANIHGYVDVFGAGSTYLYLGDEGDTTSRTVNMYNGYLTGLAPATIYWTPSSTATGGVTLLGVYGSGGGSTYTVNNTSAFYNYTWLQTGGGTDSVNVLATTGNLYDYNSGGQDYVYVGSGGAALNGTMTNINGFVDVYGAGATWLYLGDQGDATSRTVNMNNGSLTGLSPGTIYWGPSSTATGGVTFVGAYGGSGNNTYTVNNTSSFYYYTYLNTGGGNDTVNVLATTGALYVYTTTSPYGSGNDQVNLGNAGNAQGITGAVNIYNYPSSDHVTIDDSADTGNRSVTIGSSSVTGLAPAAINFVTSGSVSTLTILGGSGTDSYTVAGTPAITSVTLTAGSGTNTLIGPNVNSTWSITGTNAGTLQGSGLHPVNFTGMANLTGGSAADAFVFSDAAGVTGNIDGGSGVNMLDYLAYTTSVTVDLTVPSATGVGGTVANIQQLRGGQSSDTLTGNTGGNTTFFASPGNDTVTANGTGNILVGTNANSLWSVSAQNAGDLTWGGTNDTSFSGIQNLIGGSGNDSFALSDGVGVDGSINGGGGTNTLDESAYTSATTVNLGASTATGVGSTFANLQSFIGSGAGGNTLIGTNAATLWSITAQNNGTLTGGISFTGFQNLTGGSGNDTFVFANGVGIDGNLDGGAGVNTLNASAYTAAVTVDLTALTAPGVGGNFANLQSFIGGSNSGNTLNGPAANTTWTLSGSNAGTLSGGFSFSAFGNLTGGAGNNTFVFLAGATLSGTLTGGGGTNALDYSAYTTSVIVDLQTNFATGVGAALSGTFTNVHGANSSGSGLYNLLIGNGGNTLTGGTGRRNILVAGGSASTLIGGTQDDLLIGGTTSYDTESGLVSWQAIAAYWAGSDPYGTRVSNLESGSGVPLLDATVVTGNGGGNTMSSAFNELALIYTDGADTISGFNAGSATPVTISP